MSDLYLIRRIFSLTLLLLPFAGIGQLTEKAAYELLMQAESPEALSSVEFEIHHIVCTPLYVDMDGKGIIDFQRTSLSSADTLPTWLDGLEAGQIYTERTDSSLSLMRSFGYDSIRCFRVAAFQLTTNYSAQEIDSIVADLQMSVGSKADWNNLPAHRSHQDRGKTLSPPDVMGDMLWWPCGGLMTDFQQLALDHKVGDVFNYTQLSPDGKQLHLIVYKTHPDTWFRRNILAGISLPVE